MNDTNKLQQLIAEHPFFNDLAPQHVAVLAEAAMLKEFKAGEEIFREGDPANRFYIIRSGEVDLQSARQDMEPLSIQRIGAGDVLGWSWLFPPYYWHFAARAVTDTQAIFFLRHLAAGKLRAGSRLWLRHAQAHVRHRGPAAPVRAPASGEDGVSPALKAGAAHRRFDHTTNSNSGARGIKRCSCARRRKRRMDSRPFSP